MCPPAGRIGRLEPYFAAVFLWKTGGIMNQNSRKLEVKKDGKPCYSI